jgi:hypothetical protein
MMTANPKISDAIVNAKLQSIVAIRSG